MILIHGDVFHQTDYHCDCHWNKALYKANNDSTTFIPEGNFDSERGGCAGKFYSTYLCTKHLFQNNSARLKI